ncbi:hypothetical protein PENSPDRAFT_681613 [Peniophora sp. CONT]|nr:hypothetical protein PENSPDRAFT_681613 [Peniophora sp. CONT]
MQNRSIAVSAEMDEAAVRFEQSLREGPSAAIERFRASWDAFARSSSSLIDERGELVPSIIGLGRAFGARAASPGGPASDWLATEDIWRASVRTELPLLLLDIIIDDRFFMQHYEWVLCTVNILARFVGTWAKQTIPPINGILEHSVYTEARTPLPKTLTSQFMDRMLRFWESLWERRAQILGPEGLREERIFHLGNLAWMIQRAYRAESRQLDRLYSTKIVEVALFLWSKLSEDTLLNRSECGALFILLHSYESTEGRDGRKRILALLKHEELGTKLVLQSICLAIHESSILVEECLFDVLSATNALIEMGDHDVTLVWWKQPVLRSAVSALQREGVRVAGDDGNTGYAEYFRLANWAQCLRLLEAPTKLVHVRALAQAIYPAAVAMIYSSC